MQDSAVAPPDNTISRSLRDCSAPGGPNVLIFLDRISSSYHIYKSLEIRTQGLTYLDFVSTRSIVIHST